MTNNEAEEQEEKENSELWVKIADALRGHKPSTVLTLLIEHLSAAGYSQNIDKDFFCSAVSMQIDMWYRCFEKEGIHRERE